MRESLPIHFDVYAADVDGSDVTRLTDNPAFDADASWSPDGVLIAFASVRDGSGDIIVMAPDGESRLWTARPDGTDLRPLVFGG